MVTPATLTTVSLTTTNNNNNNYNNYNNNNSMNNNKRKREKNIISEVTRKSSEQRISSPQTSTNELDNSVTRNISTFRIPKISRPNGQTNESTSSSSISSQVSNTKSNLSLDHHSNDDSNSQSGKRKFSLSQYKEHKRLKSNDTTQNCSADVDMRINTEENLKNSPPTTTDSDSSIISNNQSIVSPKMNDINKDVLVLKSNLSEPGVKKLIKKKVIWADENNQTLVQTSIFEIDDSEVADIHAFARQCAANISIAQLEKLMERDLCKRQHLQDMNSFDNDDRQNLPSLPALIRILLPDTIQIPIVKSQERFAQEEREKTVLQALLMRSFLPDSPGEPDGDLFGNSNSERNEPKSIPFDDNTSSRESNLTSPENDTDSISTNVSTASTIATITPSLSSLSLDKLSPEVAQILAQAQAKVNVTSATTNNSSSTIATTQTNQSIPVPSINPTLPPISNLTTTSNLLSVLLNMTRPNGIETATAPSTNSLVNPLTNLPPNFTMSPASILSINQLAANAISLGLLPPPITTNFTNPVFQPPTINSNNNSITNSSPVRFVSPLGQQSTRFNQNTNNNHYISNGRGYNRGRIYRRGLHNNNNHNNNNNRRDYYQDRNNNRNIFS